MKSTVVAGMPCKQGFTLIELSIVLVIIGLLVTVVLVGRDLIKAAEVRAQISQIEKYQQAVNTFKGKYGYLPGDIPDPDATQYGFVTRGTLQGEGDGNGIIEGNTTSWAPRGSCTAGGELTMFWRDLSKANLIDNNFTIATPTLGEGGSGMALTPIKSYIPFAVIGYGNYVNVWSYGGVNYFGLSNIIEIDSDGGLSNSAITVEQAYNIDKKIDDGYPQSGRVTAKALMWTSLALPYNWSGNGVAAGTSGSNNNNGAAPGTAAIYSSKTCYDNGGNASAYMQYSLQNANTLNCSLSFMFE